MQSPEEIERNPKYEALVHARTRLAITLSLLMLAIYMGFILLVAYAPKLLATPVAGGLTTIGIPIGIFVILSAIVLTGIYVARANAVFDPLTSDIAQEAKR